MARLGYVPHAGARALKLQRSGTVGAIFPTVDNAIFAQAIDALQQRLADAGLQLLIATCGYDVDTEARQAMNLVTRGADALALCGVGQSPTLLQFLRQRELPVVHAMTYPPPPGMVSVGFDNARAIGQAVRYLLDLGHRRIAMLAGVVRDNDRAAARVEGVKRALAAAGLALDAAAPARAPLQPRRCARGIPRADGGHAAADRRDLRQRRARLRRPARGRASWASTCRGLFPIVGFDDLEMARHIRPALTTLHVPTQQAVGDGRRPHRRGARSASAPAS